MYSESFAVGAAASADSLLEFGLLGREEEKAVLVGVEVLFLDGGCPLFVGLFVGGDGGLHESGGSTGDGLGVLETGVVDRDGFLLSTAALT